MEKTFPRWIVVVAAFAVLTAPGCKSKKPPAPKPQQPPAAASAKTPENVQQAVEQVVTGYMNAPACTDRLPFILNPQKNDFIFMEHYIDVGCKVLLRSMDTSDCAKPKNDACTVKVFMGVPAGPQVNNEEHQYCVSLKPTPKIDWRCSKGYNAVPLPRFKAEHDDARAAKLRLVAELSDVYLDEYKDAQKTMLSIHLSDVDGASIYGFVRRETEVAKVLADLLKDKKPHKLFLELGYSKRNDNRDAAAILTLYGLDWREHPAEFE